MIEGAGPRAQEPVLIGGHYDHLGPWGMLSGSLAFFSKDIHNGADDNASGTAMVLEAGLSAWVALPRPSAPPHRLHGDLHEERGLLVLSITSNHPHPARSRTVMMINCDMVGRLNTNSELTMIGTSTTPGIDAIVDALGQSAGLKIKKVSGSSIDFGGSDHESFYKKQIPVLFAFTGLQVVW